MLRKGEPHIPSVGLSHFSVKMGMKMRIISFTIHIFLEWNASLNLQEIVAMTNAVTVRSSDPWFTFLGFSP